MDFLNSVIYVCFTDLESSKQRACPCSLVHAALGVTPECLSTMTRRVSSEPATVAPKCLSVET